MPVASFTLDRIRRRGLPPLSVALLLAAIGSLDGAQIIYQTGFEEPDSRQGWSRLQHASTGPGFRGGTALQVVAHPGLQRAATVRVPLPLEKLRGTRVNVRAMIRTEDVSAPPKPHFGVKLMLHLATPDRSRYPQKGNVFGTFDWKPIQFTTNIPEDTTNAWLVLGLDRVQGRVWFDDVKITLLSRPRKRPDQPAAGPLFKGHDLPRLRGMMISAGADEADLRTLGAEWGANHVRWQLIWGGFPRSPADKGDLPAYHAWLDKELLRLDRLLPVCAEVGIKVLIDLHTPPGGRNANNECRLFEEARFQDAFLRVWDKIARRYRGNPAVWGYDLVNEPIQGLVADDLRDWRELADETVRRVRRFDADRAIIIEPGPGGSPDGLVYFEPLPYPNLVYSVHMYLPHQFTHQGVHGGARNIRYPGVIAGKKWDREQLRRALQPVRDFQRDYGVHIYIGEFSVVRWAPGDSARAYLADLIDVMEEYGWDWAYHVFRGAPVWSVEHGPDPLNRQPVSKRTNREKLLRGWFAKNRKAR